MYDQEQWPAPVRALAAYLAHNGEQVTELRQVSERRGSRAWKVVTTGGAYALKANTQGRYEERDKRAELQREARVITELDRLGAIPAGYLTGAGRWESGPWLAVACRGPSRSWRTSSPGASIRTQVSGRAPLTSRAP